MSVYEQDRPPRLAWGMYKRFALGAVVIFLLATTTTATAVLLEVKGAADIFSSESVPIPGIDEQGVLDDVDPGGPQTILVLGSDRRYIDIKQRNPVRSDTMLLVRLDPSRGATALMSIPRDLKVEIPGHGTDKINAAYAVGGPKLAVRTTRRLLGIPINHVVNVNFGGFRRAVNRLGCVYVDVDRRYFNDNDPPTGGGPDYAVIDIKAGYQKLCGQDGLDYVRYRHFDSDLVRAARQQDFLRQAKEQVGVSKLFGDRRELLRIFARYTQTDIRGTEAILRLIKLAVESANHPVQEIRFPGEQTGDFIVADREDLDRTVRRFLNAKASPGPRGQAKRTAAGKRATRRQRKRRGSSDVPGLIRSRTAGEDQAIDLATRVRFPVYYPKLLKVGGQYLVNERRAYDIYDRGHHRYRAYRIVVSTGEIGQFYGIQGTTWKAAPILDNPSERRRMAGRTYELFFDGDRLRLVALRTKRAVYWVSNTLLQTLRNRQMLHIARSLTRLGAK